ncbi:MAG TPA: hypothetical protein VK524_02020 [Polyangiaceae bacterium]|nr:hypothetical protein [Polyangiaceae bacterium]
MTSNYDQDLQSYVNQIWRSADTGETWTKVGVPLANDMFPLGLHTTHGETPELYVLGRTQTAGEEVGALYRSTDGGVSWKAQVLPGTNVDAYGTGLTVSPSDPRKLYVRISGPIVGDFVDGRLLHSADSGQTWREILRVPAEIIDATLSPDGSRLFVSVGDPFAEENSRPVDRAVLGLYRASTLDHAFTRSLDGHVGCARPTLHGLYVCTHEAHQGFELGLSTDDGETAQPVMYENGILEPLTCTPGTTSAQLCTPLVWEAACRNTNRCEPYTGEPQPVRTSEICAAVKRSDEDEGASCGCRVTRRGSSAGWFGAVLTALALFRARRSAIRAPRTSCVPDADTRRAR